MFINVSVKFVSNMGQMINDDDYNITTTTNARAGAFTTGSNPKGYDLGSFKLNLRNFQIDDNATTTAKLYSGNSGKPNAALCILVNPDEQGDEIYTFAAPASCPTMDKGTDTWCLSILNVPMGITLTNVYWEVTDSPDEDGTSAVGWSLSN